MIAAAATRRRGSKAVATSRTPLCYCYTRVSTEEQYDFGVSLASQERLGHCYYETLRARLSAQGCHELEWVQVEPEQASAYLTKFARRPVGRAINQKLQRGDHLIFMRLDRGFRDTLDCLGMLEQWRERGVIVHFADLGIDMSTPAGEFAITMLAAAARLDSRMKSERIREALYERKRRGQPVNRHKPVFGRSVMVPTRGLTWVKDFDEMKWMRYARLLHHHGLSYVAMGRRLEQQLARREKRKERPQSEWRWSPSKLHSRATSGAWDNMPRVKRGKGQ